MRRPRPLGRSKQTKTASVCAGCWCCPYRMEQQARGRGLCVPSASVGVTAIRAPFFSFPDGGMARLTDPTGEWRKKRASRCFICFHRLEGGGQQKSRNSFLHAQKILSPSVLAWVDLLRNVRQCPCLAIAFILIRMNFSGQPTTSMEWNLHIWTMFRSTTSTGLAAQTCT